MQYEEKRKKDQIRYNSLLLLYSKNITFLMRKKIIQAKATSLSAKILELKLEKSEKSLKACVPAGTQAQTVLIHLADFLCTV
jgi:hypothetical protein